MSLSILDINLSQYLNIKVSHFTSAKSLRLTPAQRKTAHTAITYSMTFLFKSKFSMEERESVPILQCRQRNFKLQDKGFHTLTELISFTNTESHPSSNNSSVYTAKQEKILLLCIINGLYGN